MLQFIFSLNSILLNVEIFLFNFYFLGVVVILAIHFYSCSYYHPWWEISWYIYQWLKSLVSCGGVQLHLLVAKHPVLRPVQYLLLVLVRHCHQLVMDYFPQLACHLT